MGTLSLGRIFIINMGLSNLQKCLPISIRYSALRKQFGPAGQEELPVIEYQLQVSWYFKKIIINRMLLFLHIKKI